MLSSVSLVKKAARLCEFGRTTLTFGICHNDNRWGKDMQYGESTIDIDESTSKSAQIPRRRFAATTLLVTVGSAILAAAAEGAETKKPVTAPDNHRNADVFRRLIERGFGQGDLSVAEEVCATELIEHQYLLPRDRTGPERLKNDIVLTRKAIRDMVLTIEDLVASGDKVWVRTLCRGVESTTGKPFVMDGFDVCRFENGKIVEHWGVPDRFAMLHQVGLLPPAVA